MGVSFLWFCESECVYVCVREWVEILFLGYDYKVCHWRVSSELLVQGDEREESLFADKD